MQPARPLSGPPQHSPVISPRNSILLHNPNSNPLNPATNPSPILPSAPTQSTETSSFQPQATNPSLPSPTIIGTPVLINSFRGSTSRPRRGHREAVSISHQVVLEGAGIDAGALATIVKDQTNEQYADYVNQQFLEAMAASNSSSTSNNTNANTNGTSETSGTLSNGPVSSTPSLSNLTQEDSIDLLFNDVLNSNGRQFTISTPPANRASASLSQAKWRGLLEEKDSSELPPNLFLFAFPDGEKKLVKFEPQSALEQLLIKICSQRSLVMEDCHFFDMNERPITLTPSLLMGDIPERYLRVANEKIALQKVPYVLESNSSPSLSATSSSSSVTTGSRISTEVEMNSVPRPFQKGAQQASAGNTIDFVRLSTIPSEADDYDYSAVLLPTDDTIQTFEGIVKSAWLKVYSTKTKSKLIMCELLPSNLLKYYLKYPQEARYFSLRGRYVSLPGFKESPNMKIVELRNETGQVVFQFECESHELAIEWAKAIESVAFLEKNQDPLKKYVELDNAFVQPLSVWVGSWNVGNTLPCALNGWLPSGTDYDIIAVGTQECSYKRAGATGYAGSSEDWFERVTSTLSNEYYPIAFITLQQIKNIVFGKIKLKQYITAVETDSVPTGIANTLGNKGGVGIRFTFHSTRFCFVTCHLAAHEENVLDRNDDLKEIFKRLKFGRPDVQPDICGLNNFVFLYGDLNYRLDIPFAQVMSALSEPNCKFNSLLEKDQLLIQMKEQKAVDSFVEGAIDFMPSYRLQRLTTDEHGRRVYNPEKERIPSWCDRVLYHCFPDADIQQLAYSSSPSVNSSDHCPVYAAYTLLTRESPLLSIPFRDRKPELGGSITVKGLKAYLKPEGMRRKIDLSLVVRLTCIFTKASTTCKPCPQTYEPVWEDMSLPINGLSSTFWNTECVMIEVLDLCGRNVTVLVAQAIFSLRGCHKNEMTFSTPLALHGLTVGGITGAAKINL